MDDQKHPIDVVGQLGALRRYALSLTRDPGDAEDLVHDTLVRALERRHQFARGRNLRVWLMSILHNGFVDGIRSRRARAGREADFAIESTESPRGAPQEAAARLSDVRRAFASLPEEQRAALLLVSIEGLTYDEAAATLSIPVGTLVSRISRARARLREIENGEPEQVADSNVVRLRTMGGPHERQS